MQPSTAQNLRAIAPQILSGQVTGNEPFASPAIKSAIAVLAILNDGEWHTSKELAEQTGLSRNYVSAILTACKDEWGLASHRRNGWMMVKNDSAIVV